MKKLVVYYSFEGNTEVISEGIARAVSADILKLQPEKDIGTHGLMKYMWGGRQVVLKKTPKLEHFNINPNDYDLIFIGTPVWAFSYTPALKTFFETTEFKNKKVALFCCHAGGKGKVFENMRNALKGNEILGQIDFIDPKVNDTENNLKKAREWAEEMIPKCK